MEIGIVKEIKDDSNIIVTIQQTDDCEACPGKSSCNVFSKKGKTLNAKYYEKLEIGDKVQIEFQPKVRITASIIVFLLPIFVLIGFYYIGIVLFKKELYGMIFSGAGLFFSFIIIFLIIKFNKNMKKYLPTATKIDKLHQKALEK